MATTAHHELAAGQQHYMYENIIPMEWKHLAFVKKYFYTCILEYMEDDRRTKSVDERESLF